MKICNPNNFNQSVSQSASKLNPINAIMKMNASPIQLSPTPGDVASLKPAMNRFSLFRFALPVLAMLMLLGSYAKAAIYVHDGSTALTYQGSGTISAYPITVTAGSDVLVVIIHNVNTTGVESMPATITLGNGAVLTLAIWSDGMLQSLYRGCAIYYCYNPPVGSTTLDSVINTGGAPGVWATAYTLAGVNTSAPPFVGSIANNSNPNTTLSFTVLGGAKNSWAAVASTLSGTGNTVTLSAVGGTTAQSTENQANNSTMVAGYISGLSAGVNTFTGTGPQPQRWNIVAAIFSPSSQTAPQTDLWTGNINSTWDAATANWTNAIPGNLFVNGDSVVFGDTALQFNLTVANNVTASGVTFTNSTAKSYAFSGSGVVGGSSVTVGAGSVTFNTPVSFGSVTDGSGVLTLNNAVNSIASLTVNSGGSTVVGPSALLGAGNFGGNIVLNTGGGFTYGGSGNQTFSGVWSGAGSFTNNGGGTTLLRGASTSTGTFVINSGTVQMNVNNGGNNITASGLGNPQNAGHTVIVNNGGTLSFDAQGGNELGGGSSSVQMGLVINQGGTVQRGTLNTGNTTIGPVTLGGGTLYAGASAGYSTQYGAFEFGGNITVVTNAGNAASTIQSDASLNINLTVNQGAGALRNFIVSDATLDANPDLNVIGLLGNSANTLSAAGILKSGAGTMTLSGVQNTYSGGTVVSNGTLLVVNGGDTGPGPVTVLTNGTFGGNGNSTILGVVTVSGGGKTFPSGGTATASTLTLGSNLVYNTGSEADFVLGSSAAGGNDQIVLNGGGGSISVSGGVTTVGIKRTGALDTTADYVLINNQSGNNTAVFNYAPIWLPPNGAPANSNNFYVVTTPTQVRLRYSPISIAASITPNPALHYQVVTITLTATSSAGSISSVTVNASAIGGSSSITLVSSGGSTYTNSFTVPPTAVAGTVSVLATVTDSAANTATIPVSLAVNFAPVVWNGASVSNTWAAATNWVGLLPPAAGDLVTFAGTTNTTANMESSYTVGSLTFAPSSGSFTITNAANTLTLNGSVTNNSTNAQTLSVPVTLTTTATLNAASNNIVFNNGVSGTGGLTVVGPGTNVLNGANSFSGATTLNGNLQIGNANGLTNTSLTMNAGSRLLLRSDTDALFPLPNLTIPNAGGTWNFDADKISSGSGRTLTLTNLIVFTATSDRTIRVTGNNTYTLALGDITNNQGAFTGHNPYVNNIIFATNTGPAVSIGSIWTGTWGDYFTARGGGSVIVRGNIQQISGSGGLTTVVKDGTTLTLQGSTVQQNADAYRYFIENGTLVLDNNSAIALRNGTAQTQGYWILGPSTNVAYGTQPFSPPSGLLSTANNSFNAAIYLGDTANNTGGLSVPASLTNWVADGNIGGMVNSGVFTIGGQNTSGINTYNNPIVLGFSPNKGKGVTLVATAGGEVDFAGGILANGTDTTAGVTVGDSTHSGVVAFTGGNANTYAGGTTVTNSVLRIDSNTSATGSGLVTVVNGGKLAGPGTVSSSVQVNTGGSTLPGSTLGNTAGVKTTISGNLTVNPGGSANFNLSASPGSGCDQLYLSPSSLLIGTNAAIGIRLTGGSLSQSDYVLIDNLGGNFAGVFTNKPTWLGATPVNAANYSIVASDTQILLHYNTAGINVAGTVTNNPSYHGQTVTIYVTASGGSGGITGVSVDVSAINAGLGTLNLTAQGGGLFTGTVAIDSTVGVGVKKLNATAIDGSSNQNTIPVLLTIAPQLEVWGGGGADFRWITGGNWLNGLNPVSGDTLIFSGTTKLTPNMDSSYTVGSVTFTNGAGSFNITNFNNNLTLLGGVTNRSSNVQTIGVPITLAGPNSINPSGLATLNALGTNIIISTNIAGPGGVLSIGAANTTNTIAGDINYGGPTIVSGNTLVLSGNNNVASGSLVINSGTLSIAGNRGQLNGGTYDGNITNNGSFSFNATNALSLTGTMTGTGGLTVNSTRNDAALTIGQGAGNIPAYSWAYTGPTLVNKGTLNISFPDQGASGIYRSSSLTINNGGKVVLQGSSGLTGYTSQSANMPITINSGGELTSLLFNENEGVFAAPIFGILTLNGGTLSNPSPPNPTQGGWELFNTVNVNGTNVTSVISDPYLTIGQTGGQLFNITNNGATSSGIDLDVKGSLTGNFSGKRDTGVIISGNGTMALESTNSYVNATTINSGATLILTNNGQFGTNGSYAAAINLNGTLVFESLNVTQYLSGLISGTGVVKVGSPTATLILPRANTYSGGTVVNQGTLLVTNTSGSATGSGTVTVNNLGNLGGHGSIAGGVTFNTGAKAIFNLDTTFNSANNDKLILTSGSSPISPNGVSVGINVLNGSLDQSGDYVLFSYVPNTITGTFSNTPVWLGTQPSNPQNYSIVTLSNTVVLHYATGSFVTSGSASPNPTTRNTLVTFTVTASAANPISSVTLNASVIGGSSSLALVSAGGGIWTNSVVVASSSPAGGVILPYTVVDNSANSTYSSIELNIQPGNDIWSGGGADNQWLTGLNWQGGVAAVSGDLLTFAGTTQTTANMQSSYSAGWLVFSNNAGSFNITNGANTLTLNGSITNNSANPQTLSVPVSLGGVTTFNAAAGNITVSNSVSGGGGIIAIGTPTTTNLIVGDTSYNGATTVSSGTLAMQGNDLFAGSLTVGGGTLNLSGSAGIGGTLAVNSGSFIVSGAGQLNNGFLLAGFANNGSFVYNSSAPQTFAGALSGSGTWTFDSTNTIVLSAGSPFTGNVVINRAIVSHPFANNALNITASGLGNPQVAHTVTINNGGVLSLDGPGGNDFGNGQTIVQIGFIINTNSTMQITLGNATIGPVTLNGGRLVVGAGASTSAQFGAYEFGADITVGGSSRSVIVSSNSASVLNLAINAVSTRTFNVADATGDATSDLDVSANLGNSGNAQSAVLLVKTGAGTMTLSGGANIYSGGTTVSNGTLVVNNATGSGTGAGAVTVLTNATLGGKGTIGGAVTVQSGGKLVVSAGTNIVGSVLTLSNSLTLASGSFTTNYISHNSHTNDQIVNLGALTYGGTLNVLTAAGDGALVAGDSFKLFKFSTTPTGSFSAVNLPALNSGLAWTNNLAVDGTISVVTVAASAPTLGGAQFVGGNLVMSGTGGTPFAAYRILTTTNLTVPVASWTVAYTNIFDASGNYSYTNSGLTNGSSFFRLATP
jgi:autotransporter-associated beta strand protein